MSRILIRLSPPLVPAKRNHNNRITSGSDIEYCQNNNEMIKSVYFYNNMIFKINDFRIRTFGQKRFFYNILIQFFYTLYIIQRVIFKRPATPASSAMWIIKKNGNKPWAYSGVIAKYA
jgi:hypothetical protein